MALLAIPAVSEVSAAMLSTQAMVVTALQFSLLMVPLLAGVVLGRDFDLGIDLKAQAPQSERWAAELGDAVFAPGPSGPEGLAPFPSDHKASIACKI